MYCEPFRPRRAGLHVLIFALAVLFAAPNQAMAVEDTRKLRLLPIVVHSAEDPKYVRDGLADMLTSRFSRIGGLELVRLEDPSQGTTDRAKAMELGRKAGADFVLDGSFTRFGQGASLDVQCLPTDESKGRAPLREIFVHSGSIGEIIPDLDELAGKVSRFIADTDWLGTVGIGTELNLGFAPVIRVNFTRETDFSSISSDTDFELFIGLNY